MDNFFNDIDFSTDKQAEDFFTDLVDRALKGKQSDFEFIRSWQERRAVRTYRFGVEAIIKIFINLGDSTYKTYVEQIRTGSQDLETLLALKQFKQCLRFYTQERDIARDMLKEHAEYIWNWHIIDTLIGNYRPEEDLWDHRGNKPDGK